MYSSVIPARLKISLREDLFSKLRAQYLANSMSLEIICLTKLILLCSRLYVSLLVTEVYLFKSPPASCLCHSIIKMMANQTEKERKHIYGINFGIGSEFKSQIPS